MGKDYADGGDAWAKYRDVQAGLRADVQVSRHIYQGEPAYLAHDPVSFRTHRFSFRDYAVLTALSQEKALGDVFGDLVTQGRLQQEDEGDFYQFVLTLHRLGLLAAPIHDGSELFDRHQMIRATVAKGGAFRFLFWQVPLANPDRFLSGTIGYVQWLFTVPFLIGWLVAGIAALSVVMCRLDEFVEPLNGILAAQNLPFLWCALIGLKVWHELGHGYACKRFGGRVPEMGALLIAGTPAAYVDASAAWSFESKRHRLIVMCGGMFFESLVAIPAVFVWAAMPHSFLGSCAFQLVFMASIITVLFNANPLMRFDGYFIACEILGIHNLRPQGVAEVHRVLKHVLLGIQTDSPSPNPRLRVVLLVYGVAAFVYKQLVILTIAASIASKFLVIGFALAAYYLLTNVAGAGLRLAKYLLWAPETASVRVRARCCAAGLFVGVPLLLLVAPVPFAVSSPGIVGAEDECVVRAESPGILQRIMAKPNTEVTDGATLAKLENPELDVALAVSQASLLRAQTKYYVTREVDFVESAKLQRSIGDFENQVAEQQRQHHHLAVMTPLPGRVVDILKDSQVGQYVQAGDAIATVVNGQVMIRTWLDADQVDSIQSTVGSAVSCRFPGRPTRELQGVIESVHPAAIEIVEATAVTQIAGGDILVNPLTGEPVETLFEARIALVKEPPPWLQHGTRASLRFTRSYESLGMWICRRCLVFIQKMNLA